MKSIILRFLPAIDFLLLPLVYPAAWLLKNTRRIGVQKLPQCRNAFFKVGVFPIQNHYYEPQFNHHVLTKPLSRDRVLPAINWNASSQLEKLNSFTYAHELSDIPTEKSSRLEFYFGNGSFESGDAEYWYQLIRTVKPRRIIEIGSGNSTLIAIKAIKKNSEEDGKYSCDHTCIEPYEMPWLEQSGVSVIRTRIEDIDPSFFEKLESNDILFIDSSHIIRPQGDVLFEYLELLPTLNLGVIVHIHDIFSPKNYPSSWLKEQVRFWNEQYILEAFLSHNTDWEIVGALNYLHHNHYQQLKSISPFLTPEREPGSFYLRKIT
ncbi:MAG: class I SAM-dependent methyltransferase [Cyanobacteria bacterium J06650_10]